MKTIVLLIVSSIFLSNVSNDRAQDSIDKVLNYNIEQKGKIKIENGKVHLKKGATDIGDFETVFLIQNKLKTSITLSVKSPLLKPRKYEGDFDNQEKYREFQFIELKTE